MKKLLLISALLVCGCQVSDEALTSIYEGYNDYFLCVKYFAKGEYWMYSDEEKYTTYKITINEIDERNLNCRSYPDLDWRNDFMRDWVKEYEESLEQ
tara:strand:+ start:405 stop:695 length:291 start_codon:yes stop_codon:yes gene_type:complete